jgi:hypothetical protein
MLRFNLLLISILLGFSFLSEATVISTTTDTSKRPPRLSYWTISMFIVSWQEQANLQNANLKDSAYANFYGNGINLSRKSYFRSSPHHGTVFDLGILYGSTTIGGTQSLLTYQASNLAWWGISSSYRYIYRPNTILALSIGPEVLNRQITYANMNGTSATSGANLNYGLLAEMKERLTDHFELQQSLGSLAVNASTLWYAGLGYVF